jgi:undecaprenyl pyrophosphate phosphatase UppP
MHWAWRYDDLTEDNPLEWFQIIFLAILQGATELFPISSLGHAVIVPALLGWQALLNNPGFLGFLVILHFGTAAALLLYFRADWIGLLAAFSTTKRGATRRASHDSVAHNRHRAGGGARPHV